METITLEVSARDVAQKPRAIRASGLVPGVVYGAGMKPVTIAANYQALRKVHIKAGANTIVSLNLGGKGLQVLIKDVSFDPVTDQYQHIDFLQIDMNKEVTSSVKVEVVGVSPAVKNLGGIMDVQKHSIKIKCLPKDLIHTLQVDVTPIVDFHTSVHVSDLVVPAGITILDNAADTVVTVSPMRAEEEKTTAPAATATTAEGAAAPAPGNEGAAPAADKGGDKK